MKHFAEECLEGKFASITKADSDTVLSLLPAGNAKQTIGLFFECTRMYAHVLQEGSLGPGTLAASEGNVAQLHKTLLKLVEKLTALGQAGPDVFSAESLQLASSCEFVEQMRGKMEALTSGNQAEQKKALQKAIDGALSLLTAIPISSEKEFRETMKRQGSKLAGKQHDLKNALQQYASCQQEGLETEPTDLASKATAAEQRCLQYTCVYVCFTLYSNPDLRQQNTNGKKLRSNLAQTLATFKSGDAEQDIFAEKVEEIRAFAAQEAASGKAKNALTVGVPPSASKPSGAKRQRIVHPQKASES